MDDAAGRARALLDRQRRAQGGAVTRAQALAGGYSPGRLRWLVRSGRWVALERGTYVDGEALRSASVHQEHALRVAARALATGGDAVACRRSAAVVLGLPALGGVPSVPLLVRPSRRPQDSASSPTLRVAALDSDDVVRWRGVRCTSPARLVCDLARTQQSVEALMVADAALRAGLPHQQLLSAAQRARGWPGAASIAPVLAAADRRVDTPLESLTRWVMLTIGLPPPQSQVDVRHRGVFLGRVDFAWPELGVVLECDGMLKYRGRDGALVQEKRRELGLRRAGLEVVRTGWADAMDGGRQIAALWRAHTHLASATAPLRAETTFVLARLEDTGQNGIPFPSRAATPLTRVAWPLP